jgi:hypothetical protein
MLRQNPSQICDFFQWARRFCDIILQKKLDRCTLKNQKQRSFEKKIHSKQTTQEAKKGKNKQTNIGTKSTPSFSRPSFFAVPSCKGR